MDSSAFFTTNLGGCFFETFFFLSIEHANPRYRSYGSMFLFGCLFFSFGRELVAEEI